MWNKSSKKTWSAPLLLAATTLFGLLAALLGTGLWYPISWLTMSATLVIITWKIKVSRKSEEMNIE